MFDVWRVREDFPMLKKKMNGKPLIYLDTAATAQKPQEVIDAIHHFYEEDYGTVHRAIYELAARATERYSSVRTKVQQFINAREEEEIVFTRGATEGINLVANSYGRTFLREGDEIIITEMEHHSNIVPWQLLAKERGLTLKYIPLSPEGNLQIDLLPTLFTEQTKLVAVSHLSNALGTINPVKEIIDLAHSVGAKVLIDGSQAASHMSLDMQELDADFYVFSGHKMYGPTGVGILYGKLSLLEAMPPFIGGGDMVETVTMDKTTFQSTPLKFEAGTPSIASVIGLGVAIDYIQKIGRPAIEEWQQKLVTFALNKLEQISGITIVGSPEKRGPIVSFTSDAAHPLDLGTLLGLKGIATRTGHLCAQPALQKLGLSSLVRLSFGVYNTIEEIDAASHAIREGIILLNPVNAT